MIPTFPRVCTGEAGSALLRGVPSSRPFWRIPDAEIPVRRWPSERAGEWNTIKSAAHLEDVLTDLQCDASGRVNYGRPFGYAWLLAHWPGNPDDRPCVRTLKRHMAKLKRAGIVQVKVVGFGGGMIVRLLRSAKWQGERPTPAEQLSLLLPRVAPIRPGKTVDKPVEKQRESSVLTFTWGQMCPLLGDRCVPVKKLRT